MSANNYPYINRKLVYKGSVDSGFQEPIDPLVPHESTMEINNHFAHISRKPDMNQSPLASPILERRHPQAGMYNNDQQLQQQIASLKQQQEFQQQLLVQQFRQKQQQMAQEHEIQLQEHIKVQQVSVGLTQYKQHLVLLQKQQEFLQEQQKLQERHRLERERMEKERLEQLKNKTKNEESAVASSEVKLRLQEFVLTKKHREAAARNSPPFHNWVEQNSPPQSGLSPPFGPHLLGKYDRDDFPLRKTASEPNLKVRSALKQKLESQRRITHSPILRRKDKASFLKRKPLSIECSSNSDSGPNSPPAGPHGALPNGNLTSLHSKEDSCSYQMASLYRSVGYHGSDLHLSPSLPNISLGRPPSSSGTNNSSPHSDSDIRALEAGRMMSGHPHQAGVPYYPPVPGGMENEPTPHHPAYISTQMKLLEESRSQGKLMSHVSPYNAVPANTGSQTSEPHHSRIHRHKPLGRTQSAPLPLGHPFLQQQNLLLQQQHSQQVKQHIRQAVLQRAGMENVDEETEAKLQQEMRESREQDSDDVIVVKESKMDDSSNETLKPQQTFPNHPRETVKRHRHHHHRPLARTQSSPLVTFSNLPQQTQESDPTTTRYRYTTGLAYDSIMQKHQCTCNNNSNHPENEGRLHSIWSRLHETGLTSRCERIKSRKASMEELQS